MTIELHHLHPGHDDELSRLKARIAELEKLNHELEEERRWRKFSEEKPEKREIVFVRMSDGFYRIAMYLARGLGWDIGDGAHHKSKEVTHWMPLPKTLEEDK